MSERTPVDELLHEDRKPRAPISWVADEYNHTEKTSEWYWALGLIAVASTVAAVLFNNILFAILILIGSFVLALFASRKPEKVHFAVTQRGIRVNERLHSYQGLQSFTVVQAAAHHEPKLLVEVKHFLSPMMVIPIVGVDPDHVHDFLLDFLPEEDHVEPLSHHIMEWLGF